LLVENKVKSGEHDKQTQNYHQWLVQTREGHTVDIPLFLTPISTLELSELDRPQCTCEEFLQINYQYLVDYVITSCLQQDLGPRARWMLEDYVRALSYPAFTNPEDSLIMALGKEERKLLSDFWEEHRVLLSTMMSAISQDPDQEEEVRGAAKDFANVSSKDRSDVQVLVDGQVESSFPYKADVGHEVVRVLLSHDLVDEDTFERLRKDRTTKRPLLKQESEMEGDEATRRYRTKEGQEIEYGGDTYYASSQWTADAVHEFNRVVQDILPSGSSRVEVRLV
jgi:hypothetical protein